MGTFLFKKTIDQSLLKSGLTIPTKYQQLLLSGLGIDLQRGEKHKLNIVVADHKYEAILTSVNFNENYSARTVLQIRYSEGSEICKMLKDTFSICLPCKEQRFSNSVTVFGLHREGK